MISYVPTSKDRLHVFVSNPSCATLHSATTPEHMATVTAIETRGHVIPVNKLKSTESTYFTGYYFYEINL